MELAERLRPFGTTIFAEITARANAAGAVNLGQGFPDFDGPEWVKEAAARAVREQGNQYAPMPGLPELRGALARVWQRGTGIVADAAGEITVTAGCTEAIPACLLGLVNTGERVVVFEPFYDSYPASVAMAGAEVVTVPLRRDGAGGYGFDGGALRRACAGARALILNTPHNPTGKVFSRAELEAVAGCAREFGLIVIADEVYERLVYDGREHVRVATLPGMWERTLTLGSLGKTFSLTGWKIGWVIGPGELMRGVRAAHQFLTFAVATPLQRAAAEALERADEGFYAELARVFAARRDRLAKGLREIGFGLGEDGGAAGGGYFILADHRAVSARLGVRAGAGVSADVAVCHALIARAGVATIPPTAFCRDKSVCEDLLRFAFCKTEGTIDAAVERLRRVLGG